MKTIFNKICLYGLLICISSCISLKELNTQIKKEAYSFDAVDNRKKRSARHKLERVLSQKYNKIVKDSRKLDDVGQQTFMEKISVQKNKVGEPTKVPVKKKEEKRALSTRKIKSVNANSMENKCQKHDTGLSQKTKIGSKLLDSGECGFNKVKKQRKLSDQIPLVKKGESAINKLLGTFKKMSKSVVLKKNDDDVVEDSLSEDSDSTEVDPSKVAKEVVDDTISQETQPTVQSDIDTEAANLVSETQEQDIPITSKGSGSREESGEDLVSPRPETQMDTSAEEPKKKETLKDDTAPEIDELHSDLNRNIDGVMAMKTEKEKQTEEDLKKVHEIDTSIVHKEDSVETTTYIVPVHHEAEILEHLDTEAEPTVAKKDEEPVVKKKDEATDEQEVDTGAEPTVVKKKDEATDEQEVDTEPTIKEKVKEEIDTAIATTPIATQKMTEAADQLKETREQVKVIAARTKDKEPPVVEESTLIIFSAFTFILTLFALI